MGRHRVLIVVCVFAFFDRARPECAMTTQQAFAHETLAALLMCAVSNAGM